MHTQRSDLSSSLDRLTKSEYKLQFLMFEEFEYSKLINFPVKNIQHPIRLNKVEHDTSPILH